MIKKLMNISDVRILGKEELKNVMGGDDHVVTKEEYCSTLLKILLNNKLDEGALEGARIGAERAGC